MSAASGGHRRPIIRTRRTRSRPVAALDPRRLLMAAGKNEVGAHRPFRRERHSSKTVFNIGSRARWMGGSALSAKIKFLDRVLGIGLDRSFIDAVEHCGLFWL